MYNSCGRNTGRTLDRTFSKFLGVQKKKQLYCRMLSISSTALWEYLSATPAARRCYCALLQHEPNLSTFSLC